MLQLTPIIKVSQIYQVRCFSEQIPNSENTSDKSNAELTNEINELKQNYKTTQEISTFVLVITKRIMLVEQTITLWNPK